MNCVRFLARAAVRWRIRLLLLLPLPLAACGSDDRVLAAEAPLVPGDSIAPGGGDSLPSDSTPPQIPLDPATPPVDSTAAPPPPGSYVGIPFGPFGLPAKLYGEQFNATFRALPPKILLSELEAARQAGARVIIRLVGGHRRYRGKSGGFDMELWKARLDRYRDIDFSILHRRRDNRRPLHSSMSRTTSRTGVAASSRGRPWTRWPDIARSAGPRCPPSFGAGPRTSRGMTTSISMRRGRSTRSDSGRSPPS